MTLQEIIDSSDNIVFFAVQVCQQKAVYRISEVLTDFINMKYDYPPETILSHTFFMNNTEEFYKFYRDKRL